MTETPTNDDQVLAQSYSMYTKTLTYNVIIRYDPKLTGLLYETPLCQVFKYKKEAWEKTDYNGVLAVYSRDGSTDGYDHGVIILNRVTPENFSLGLLSKAKSASLGKREMVIEYQTDYIIIQDTEGNVWGYWIHEVNDRDEVYKVLKAVINGESLTPAA